MILASKFSKIVGAVVALAVTGGLLSAVPANAATPTTHAFTVTNDVTHLELTNLVGTQGVAIDETYTVNFDNSGWDFSNGSGYGLGGIPDGVNYSMTLSQDKKSFSLHIFGTPTTGWYQKGVLNVIDTNAVSENYYFDVQIAATTPTPHIIVNGTPHTYGDVTNFFSVGLFASMPQLYLDRKDSSPLIPIDAPNDVYATTKVLDGVTTISYNSDTLYVDPTYGNIHAAVTITITDGVIAYSVSTWSETYEGMTVAAGDVVLKSTLVSGKTSASNTLTGGAVSVYMPGAPYAVFDSETNSFDVSTGVETSSSASSDAAHSFNISFYDYSGCPNIAELDAAKLASTLPVTGYVSNSSCSGYLPVFRKTDFGNQTVGSTISWDAGAEFGPSVYTIDSGSLPAGLSLNSATGEITGTATTVESYSFTVKATNDWGWTLQGYFGDITAVPGPAPVLTFSSHTLPLGGTITMNVSGDPTGYGICAFVVQTPIGCIPISLSENMSVTFDWASFYPMFGANLITFRLYKQSDVADPYVGTAWDKPYASGDYFDIAPATLPDAVIDLTATADSYDHATLSWTIPSDGYSPITSYKIYQDGVLVATIDSSSPDWPQNGATTVSTWVTGLSKSTTYNFKVVAVNDIGDSADATASATTPATGFTASPVGHSVVGTAYSAPVTIDWSGFFGNKIQSVVATSGLPAGITFSGACSEACSFGFSGTPTLAGTYPVTLTMTLDDSTILTTTVTIVVDPAAVGPVVSKSISKSFSFAGDSAVLSGATKVALHKLVAYAKAHQITTLVVTGYTLKTASAKQSWRSNLGLARAKNIAKYLKTLNPKLHLTVSGKGLVNKGRIATVTLVSQPI